MAYVILTVAQATALADRIQTRLNAEVQRAGAALDPPWVPPTFGGLGAVLSQNTCRVVIDNGDDDQMAGPKTVVVVWRDTTDPPRELWVLHLWGPSNRLLALGLFVCDAIIAQFGSNWTVKFGVGLPYSNRFAQIIGATITDGVARQNIQVCRDAIAALGGDP